MGITRILSRPGFILASLLVIITGLIGLLGQQGIAPKIALSMTVDLMKFMGIGLAMAVIMSYAGYVSFGHSVFIGLGSFAAAYTVTVLEAEKTKQLSKAVIAGTIEPSVLRAALIQFYVESILIAILISAAIALTVGLAVLRLRGAYFAIATIGLNFAVLNAVKLFMKYKVPTAVGDIIFIPNIGITDTTIYWMHFASFVVTIYIAYLVKVSRLGYGLSAIREDEDAAEVMGVPTFKYKVIAFTIAAILASLWGVSTAFRESFKADDHFSLLHSVIMILENSAGGIGTFTGPIIGALIYYPLKYLTQTVAAELALAILGGLIVVIVTFFPEGIVGLLRASSPKLRKVLE